MSNLSFKMGLGEGLQTVSPGLQFPPTCSPCPSTSLSRATLACMLRPLSWPRTALFPRSHIHDPHSCHWLTSCTVLDSGQYRHPRGPVSLHSTRDRDTPHVNLAFQAFLRVSSAKGLFALVLREHCLLRSCCVLQMVWSLSDPSQL